MLTIPVSLDSSPTNDSALEKWKNIYLRGRIQGPAIATVAGLAHASVAYAKWNAKQEFTYNALAAAATIGIVPYTWIVMTWTNSKLMNAANTGEGKENARKWIITWARLNVLRGLLPLAGGILSLVAIVQ